jgi:hypothetical protein
MNQANCPRSRFLLFMLFAYLYLPLAGCNDESKTSGTMVQVSEEEKARLATKRESYKGGSPQSKKAKAAVRKK